MVVGLDMVEDATAFVDVGECVLEFVEIGEVKGISGDVEDSKILGDVLEQLDINNKEIRQNSVKFFINRPHHNCA